jgi:hypothetical protein
MSRRNLRKAFNWNDISGSFRWSTKDSEDLPAHWADFDEGEIKNVPGEMQSNLLKAGVEEADEKKRQSNIFSVFGNSSDRSLNSSFSNNMSLQSSDVMLEDCNALFREERLKSEQMEKLQLSEERLKNEQAEKDTDVEAAITKWFKQQNKNNSGEPKPASSAWERVSGFFGNAAADSSSTAASSDVGDINALFREVHPVLKKRMSDENSASDQSRELSLVDRTSSSLRSQRMDLPIMEETDDSEHTME